MTPWCACHYLRYFHGNTTLCILKKTTSDRFRSVTDPCILWKSGHRSVWEQMWPVGPENDQWKPGSWTRREVRVRLSACLPACDPSVHEPLPQTFAKEAVAALFAKVRAGQCWTKLVLLEKQIFVHTCKISCLGPIRHTFTKNINDAFKYMASLPICCECICHMSPQVE